MTGGAKFAYEQLLLDLHAHDEEKDGHKGVVDKGGERHGLTVMGEEDEVVEPEVEGVLQAAVVGVD